jgi:hypothetical protein
MAALTESRAIRHELIKEGRGGLLIAPPVGLVNIAFLLFGYRDV